MVKHSHCTTSSVTLCDTNPAIPSPHPALIPFKSGNRKQSHKGHEHHDTCTQYLLSHEPQDDLGCLSARECHRFPVNQETLLGLQGLLDLVDLEVLGKHFGTDSGYSFVAFHSGGWQATGLGEVKQKIT